jgi:hypothetical protein
LLGNGDGSFQAAVAEPTGAFNISPPSSIALADFNHDGNLDVAAGDNNDYTEVLLGDGDGTLTDTMLVLGQQPGLVAAADLRGNGFPELLVGLEGRLTVFLNQPTGWLVTPAVTVTPSPASITAAQSTKVTITVSGGSSAPTPTGSVTLSSGAYTSAVTTLSSGSAVIPIPAGTLAIGADTLQAKYTPDSGSSSTYRGNTGSAAITVTQTETTTSTTLTASAKTVNVDQSFTLTATVTGTSPTGSVTFKAGSATLGMATLASGVGKLTTTLAAAGAYSMTATYSGDAENKASTSPAVTVAAKRVTPVLTWSTPNAITYGTAVGATQQDATANVAGTFSYYPAAGWKPIAGTHTMTATFTPTNTAEYSVATATVTLTVNKATPVLTWATPAPITYGTAVGPTQQDAKANVDGTFSYYPAAGWKPVVGTHTMTATFTPTDTTDYAEGKQVTVTLTVNAAP